MFFDRHDAMLVPSLEHERADEKKGVLTKGGHALDNDGCDIVAVFDLRDGDNDECRWRPGMFVLVMADTEVINVVFCLAIAGFISTVVDFLFFFEGDAIANVDND